MKRKKWIVAIPCIALVLSLSLTAFAISGQKDIAVTYNNIKLMIDGKLFTPKDAQGNIVEPFTYNGTTYVPIRAVSEAFNKDVDWDGATATVTIGGQTTTYLDTMNTYQFSSAYGESFNESIGEIIWQNDVYDRAVRFNQYIDYDNCEYGIKYTEVTESSYLLNGEYLEFLATLIVTQDYEGPAVMKIYGDSKLLYTSPGVTTESKPLDILLDVKDVNTLKIEISSSSGEYYLDTKVCLADARLTK